MASAMAVAVLGLRVPLQQRATAPQMCAPGGRRVVVTGVGIVSCLGNSWDEVASSLFECKSGITNNPKLREIGMNPCRSRGACTKNLLGSNFFTKMLPS